MGELLELLKKAAGTKLVNEDGITEELRLLPPLSNEELNTLKSAIPCPLPEDMAELLAVTRGFEGGNLEAVDFAPPPSFGLEEVFPLALPIAADGFGNFWVVDLTRDSKSWGPIFYACHDAPVIVFQTDSLLHFVEEVLRFSNPPWKSEIDDVHEGLSSRIWRENPGVMSFEECADSPDADLRTFARSLDPSYEFVDLRSPKLGDGFSWGRYGPRTVNKRFGEQRLFAYQKKTRWERFKQAWR